MSSSPPVSNNKERLNAAQKNLGAFWRSITRESSSRRQRRTLPHDPFALPAAFDATDHGDVVVRPEIHNGVIQRGLPSGGVRCARLKNTLVIQLIIRGRQCR